ncbi:DsrE family protein [Croceicoccus mobilis]|uniref:DsrE family protein n=1 Tax=Croceicoccus mobilis TaxID=1703339 RepID=A0A916YSF8_9SPHN|nr:DsrE family protein [Croceicoccus mobilis]GGD58879.1 hypothetical protein GCM10010990_05220 [Croceicoccus mobilis]
MGLARKISLVAAMGAAMLTAPAPAQDMPETMQPGPVFSFGPVAEIDSDMPIPGETEFRVAFDLSKGADAGEVNRGLVSLARFFNMHAKAGVAEEDIHLAVVVHGPAGIDLLNEAAYARHHEGATNPNAKIIAELLKHDVQIIICGQSAAMMGIEKSDLLPGVKMALSAMTAHALLQQQGYTLNPF